MTTIKEIADKLHLSSATVSRALRNDETLSIRMETRSLILSTAAEMGYVSHHNKKNVRKSKKVLVIHKYSAFRSQMDSAYYYTMRTGIEDACVKNDTQYTFTVIDELSERRVSADGVVLLGNFSRQQFEEVLGLIRDLPAVVIGNVCYYRQRFNHVSFSNKESVTVALRYLKKNGHTRIGYMGIIEEEVPSMIGSRKSTYLEWVKKEGTYRPGWVLERDRGSDRVEQGVSMGKELLLQKELPTALFCANDSVALGVINAFNDAGVTIPGQVSIISHDGSYPTQYSYPPLTTVNVHPYHLGAEATRLLIQRMSKPEKYTCELLLTPTLYVRGSVRNLAEKK